MRRQEGWMALKLGAVFELALKEHSGIPVVTVHDFLKAEFPD